LSPSFRSPLDLVRPGRRFFDLLADASRNLVVTAGLCDELYERFPEAGDRAERAREAEQQGDRITAELYRLLNGTYVTPIDRADLIALARALDDACDAVEECAATPALLGVKVVPPQARAQARILLLACERLGDAVERLAQLPDLQSELGDVHALEDEADGVRRDALAHLFASGAGPLAVLRAKEMHDGLEGAINAVRAAATVVEGIVVKNG
jgi:uncharacterized protein Yka (UPF0111/DUF47 family)